MRDGSIGDGGNGLQSNRLMAHEGGGGSCGDCD